MPGWWPTVRGGIGYFGTVWFPLNQGLCLVNKFFECLFKILLYLNVKVVIKFFKVCKFFNILKRIV